MLDTILRQISSPEGIIKTLVSIVLALASLGITIEFIPQIHLRPMTYVLRAIGRRCHEDLFKEMKEIRNEIKKVHEDIDNNEIDRIRCYILDFSSQCRKNEEHTKEQFDRVIALNEKYHAILEKHGMTNGQIDVEYEYVLNTYKKLLEERRL